MKIYWASRHNPLRCQIEWLRSKFDKDIEVIIGRNDNAKEIVKDFYRKQCDEMVIVAPLWVIYHILQEGIKPLWADMVIIEDKEQADLIYRNRFYKFNGFRRIKDIQIIYEDI